MNKSEYCDLCIKCMMTCERCAFECCAETVGHAECLKACLTCADAYSSYIRACSRGSKIAEDFLNLCAKECEAYAEECEKPSVVRGREFF